MTRQFLFTILLVLGLSQVMPVASVAAQEASSEPPAGPTNTQRAQDPGSLQAGSTTPGADAGNDCEYCGKNVTGGSLPPQKLIDPTGVPGNTSKTVSPGVDR